MADDPAYKRVANTIRERIRTGELPAGHKFSPLPELGKEFDVSADVARKALSVLSAEGRVETRHGVGTFVRDFTRITRSSPGRLARSQWGSGKAIQDHDTGRRWRTVDVRVNAVPAPEDVAAGLGLAAGDTVISRNRRFFVDDRPVQIATSYYQPELVQGTAIMFTDTGPGGAYARLTEIGHAPARFTETVIARAPYPDEARDLALPKEGGIVYDVTRWAFTADKRCIEVNRMVLDASAYLLEYHFDA